MQGLKPTDGVRDADAEADADADGDVTCMARRDGLAGRRRGPGPLEASPEREKFETPARPTRPTTATAPACSDDDDDGDEDGDACVIVIIVIIGIG